jgi:hypothetical protein
MGTADDAAEGGSCSNARAGKKESNLLVNAIVVERTAKTVWPPTSYGCVRIDPKFLAEQRSEGGSSD